MIFRLIRWSEISSGDRVLVGRSGEPWSRR